MSRLKEELHQIIFEADTPAGKWFDTILIGTILASVLVVMLDSVQPFTSQYGPLLDQLEWAFTILFTIEYVFRLYCVRKPLRYAASFFGVVDLLAILPTYLSLFIPGTKYLTVIRVLRVLRVFRVFKLVTYLQEAHQLRAALHASRRKITVFLFSVAVLVVVLGSLMYVVEGERNGFSSIPLSIYWAVVTLTTVGYGDIAPNTPLGQALAAIVMVLGYGIIAVPTGIVTAELTRLPPVDETTQACPSCACEIHARDALFCRRCGARL
ncbi:MAG: ion transporter [Acidobacteria bacterium]|nr:ion transporter [Acidobacteriota bacterium]